MKRRRFEQNTVAIHNVFFQEKNYKLNYQPAQYEKNKIDKDNSGKKKQRKQKKKPYGKTL
jgi:hypothetical protein